MADRADPRTVMPDRRAMRPNNGAPPIGAQVYDRLADPLLAYAEKLALVQGEDLTGLLRHGATLLDRFAADATRAGVIAASIPPARYALALILDQKARSNRSIDVHIWAAGAHRYLFDGRDISTGTIADFVTKARDAGHDFDGIRGFLETCLARLDGGRKTYETFQPTNWTGIVAVLIVGFALAVAGWSAFVEWRYHRDLSAVFESEALQIGLDRSGAMPDLAARFDQLSRAVAQVQDAAGRAPIRLFAGLTGTDAATRAQASYAVALQRHLPGILTTALDDALASEGDPVAAYDTLRAWSVLSGLSPWSAAYLAGWAEDRAATNPALVGLGSHIARLTKPDAFVPPDAELLDQARVFAAEADEGARAFLELRRSDAVLSLPVWRGDLAIPGLTDVMQRRSGLPMAAPVTGLFTAAGWDYARDFGAGLAVTNARAQAKVLFRRDLPTRNDAPDAVMDRLQAETIAQWTAYLDDLRVQPFVNPDASVRVSGQLALAKSPLALLLAEVWAQAGGNDRGRSHAQQLAVATEYAAMIQYVEQGGMGKISSLFASLNVALDRDEADGQNRLMSAQDRASSVATLGTAPRIVVQIVEDTLAQTGASHADVLSNPLTAAWQTEALEVCLQAVDGHFPFAPGPDADIATLTRALAPGGSIDRFFRGRAMEFIDTTATPWRWKPEARFNGLDPESAKFFQKTQAISAGLFAPSGQIGGDITLSALAERGKAFMAIGGQGGPVEATADSLTLSWPGTSPQLGIEITFQSPDGEARLTEPGEWGLLKMLAPLRLRERDGGKRFLVDLKSGGARIFLEMTFPTPQNPLAARALFKDLTCPQVL